MPHNNINSVLYNHLYSVAPLFNLDGDRLISVYSVLRTSRNGKESIKAEGRLKGIGLVSRVTGISRKTLSKYLAVLISLNLVSFSRNGSLLFAGNKKLEEKYRSKSKKERVKYLKIIIGKSIAETALNSYNIRLHGYIDSIKRRIDKNETSGKLKSTKLDKVTLSVLGFGLLKSGQKNKSSKGNYWKRKAIKAGYIYTSRQYEFIECCTYEEYKSIRFSENDRTLRWENNKLYKELPSLISTTLLPPGKEIKTKTVIKSNYKKKDYLQLDMIDFWKNM